MFPFSTIERAMVFGAHPDDEIIGPGGTIHRLARRGAEVTVVTFTCGETAAHSDEQMEEMAALRATEMNEANQILGVAHRQVLTVPSQQVYGAVYSDNRLHHQLIRLLRQYRPQVLFAHAADNHRDHCAIARIAAQSAFQAAEGILGSLGEPWQVGALLRYGVERELKEPDVVVCLAPEDLEAKVRALRTQLSQSRQGYLQRFEQMVESRARLWGAKMFGPGQRAECFRLEPALPLQIP